MFDQTIFDAYSIFQETNQRANKLTLRSVIHRFLAEPWGGEAPKGNKATNEEVFKFIELIKTLPSTLLADSMELLKQKFTEKGIRQENSKSYKSAYKTFFDWAENNNYFLAPTQEPNSIAEIQLSNHNILFNRNTPGMGAKPRVRHNRKLKNTYSLMALNNYKGSNSGKLAFPNDYINDNLLNDLSLYKKFRIEDCACTKSTVKKDLGVIYRMLGWLHRYKNIPLEKLRLTSIIGFVKLNINRNSFKSDTGNFNHQEYVNCKGMVRQDAEDLARENKSLIKEYLDFCDVHPGSKIITLTVVIAIAKFVFRNEIGTDDYPDYDDLAIARKLKQLSKIFNKLNNNTPPSVSHSAKSVTWSEALSVLQILRLRADYLTYEKTYHETTKLGKVYSRTRVIVRKESTVNDDLQAFLSLAFMLLIPTDRARTYYELKIGETFVCGLLQNNKFTPIEKLKDKNQATWHIHLMPGNYKTGKIYKEYWGIMPNVEFEDGKKLYEYIDRWVNKGRECQQKCNHNLFFRGRESYKPLNVSDWGSRIKTPFESLTGVPVTPKEIRKMYITHLNNSGATNAELKGAAYAMHHSQKMQESVYNSQTTLDRIAPIYELNERIWKEATTPPPGQLIAA